MLKKLSFLLVLFVATYMAAHFGIRWKNRSASEPKTLSKLIPCEAHLVKGVVIGDRSGASSEFRRVDTPPPGTPPLAQMADARWDLAGRGEADAPALNRLASMACDFFAPDAPAHEEFRAATEGASFIQWSVEGLGEFRLDFGQPTSGRLVQGRLKGPQGEERMVHMQPKLFQLASLPTEQQLNRRVARMLPDTVQEARLLVSGKERFRLEREGADWRVKGESGAQGSLSSEGRKFVNRLTTLQALDSQVGPCKMDRAPDLVVELGGLASRQEKIKFLRGKAGGQWTACSSDREATFTIHRDIAKYIEPSLKSLKSGH